MEFNLPGMLSVEKAQGYQAFKHVSYSTLSTVSSGVVYGAVGVWATELPGNPADCRLSFHLHFQ
jgi:hypothetical protein